MEFWKLFWEYNNDIETLKSAVKCESNPFGEITPEEYKEICGEEFSL